MMHNPLVSVYITTKDRPDFLVRALKSVKNQTYRNIEVIVVDDGSKHDAYDNVKPFLDSFVNLVYARNEKSLGACRSRNIAVKKAKGELVTGLDDDDYFEPNRVLLLVSNYDSKYSLLCSNFLIKTRKKVVRSSYLSRVISKKDLLNRNCVGNQALFERERFLSIGGFDDSLRASQDLDLWLRFVSNYGPAKRIPEVLYVMDTSHDLPRITLSENRVVGTTQFIDKHRDDLSIGQVNFKLDSFGVCSSRPLTFKKIYFSLYRYGLSVVLEMIRHKLKLG